MRATRLLRQGLGLGIAGLFLWLMLRQIHLPDLIKAFNGARWSWLLAAMAAFAVGYACRIARWRLMLTRDNPEIRWRDCAGPLLASFAANNVLPLRAGDVLRAFAFNDKLHTTSGVVVATLFAERLLDLLMVLALFAIALSIFDLESHRYAGIGVWGLTILAATIVLLLLAPQVVEPMVRWACRLCARVFPAFGARLSLEVDKSFATLKHLAMGGTMLRLLAWSGLAWFAEGCVFWFSARALPVLANDFAAWLALPVGTLATLIPSTPGYVGTFDYFILRAVTSLGNSETAGAAYALLVHFLLWLPPTLVGGLYLLRHSSLRNPDFKRYEHESNA